MAKLEEWQIAFIGELKEMTNREIYDTYISMLCGSFDGYEKNGDPGWQVKKTAHELDFRLKDWYLESEVVDWDKVKRDQADVATS